MILTALATLFLVLAALSLAWLVLIHLLAWVYWRRHPTAAAPAVLPPVSVIRPVFAATDAALGALRSFCEQDYPAPCEVLFCCERGDAGSIAVVNRVLRAGGGARGRLVLSDERDARAIGKLKNTITALAHARHEVVVFADDDVEAPRSYLREAVPALAGGRTGLAFSAPAYHGVETPAAALMALFTNSLVLRLATACSLGVFDGAVGTTMITRRRVIDDIGGLAQFGRQVVDDIPLGRAIARRGYRIRLLRAPARVPHRRDTLARCWSHLHRWLVIVRHHYPVRHWLMTVLDLGLWWALLHAGLTLLRTGTPGAGAYLVPALALGPVVSAAIVNATFVRDPRAWRFLWVAVLLELLRLPLAVHSGVTRSIRWRGRRLRVNRDGTVTDLARSPQPARRQPGAALAAGAGAGTPPRSEP